MSNSDAKRRSNRRYRQSEKGKARRKRWLQSTPRPARYEKAQRELHESTRKQMIAWLRELKAKTPCLDCGGIFDPVCMDFDHRPGEIKLGTVSHMATKAMAIAEMAKCDLVCANCHRIRTWKRREHPHKLAREAAADHPQLTLDIIEAKPLQCVRCSQEASPGKKSCEVHLKFDRDRDAARRTRIHDALETGAPRAKGE